MIDLLRRTASQALDAALPAVCVGCGREGPPLCDGCLPALDRRLEAPAGVPIGLSGDLPAPLLQLDWCAPFSGTVRSALHAIKYGGEQRLAEPLGAAIARRWARVGVGTDIVTHVPVHAGRARTRGYDQAELIARAAARHLRLPYASLLTRERDTIAQFDLDRRDRAANVAGAFVAGVGGPRDAAGLGGPSDAAGAGGPRDAAGLGPAPNPAGRWVLLVDDVVTTGATLAACADALERVGALATSAITVARER